MEVDRAGRRDNHRSVCVLGVGVGEAVGAVGTSLVLISVVAHTDLPPASDLPDDVQVVADCVVVLGLLMVNGLALVAMVPAAASITFVGRLIWVLASGWVRWLSWVWFAVAWAGFSALWLLGGP